MSNTLPPRRLSSGTLFYKKVIPWLWAAGMAMVVAIMGWRLAAGAPSPLEPWPYLAVCAVALTITKVAASGMVDEVIDAGSHLVVRVGKDEQRVALAEIDAVKESLYLRQPHRIELVLSSPGKFGRTITFVPSGFLPFPFMRTELFHELKRRVAAARQQPVR